MRREQNGQLQWIASRRNASVWLLTRKRPLHPEVVGNGAPRHQYLFSVTTESSVPRNLKGC